MSFTIGAYAAHRHRLARWLGKATRVEPAGPQILRAFADTYPKAMFIEIGANDGVFSRPMLAQREATPAHGLPPAPDPYRCSAAPMDATTAVRAGDFKS
jgi:hypothetical protein